MTFGASATSAVARVLPWLFGAYLVSLLTSMSGMEIFSSLCLLALIWYLVVNRPERKPPVPPFLPALAVFALIVGIGIYLGKAPSAEKWHDAGRLRFVVWYAGLFYLLRYPMRDFPWLPVLAVAAALMSVYGICQHFMPLDLFRPEGKQIILYAIPETKTGPLVLGAFNHHLTFSNVFLFPAALFFSLGIGDWRRRWYYLLLGLVLFLLCLWTQSRAAWIAVPVTAFIIALGKSGRLAVGAAVLGAVALTTLYYTDAGFHQRFERTFFQEDDFYNGGPRTRLWSANWQMFKESPWLGIGWNNNERFAKPYVDKLFPAQKDNFYGHAHSEIIQVLATTGLLGLTAYLLLWAAVFLRLARATLRLSLDGPERWIALGLLGGFIGFHLQGLTQWNFGDAEVLHNVIFYWAIAAGLGQPRFVPKG